MIPPQPPKNADALDLISQSVERRVEHKDKSGQIIIENLPDNLSLWWKSQIVNSPHFAAFAFELMTLANLGKEAYNNMSPEMAMVLEKEINDTVAAYMYSVDAKSSETVRDSQNIQSSLVHLLVRDHMERTVTLKDGLGEKSRLAFLGGGGGDQPPPQY